MGMTTVPRANVPSRVRMSRRCSCRRCSSRTSAGARSTCARSSKAKALSRRTLGHCSIRLMARTATIPLARLRRDQTADIQTYRVHEQPTHACPLRCFKKFKDGCISVVSPRGWASQHKKTHMQTPGRIWIVNGKKSIVTHRSLLARGGASTHHTLSELHSSLVTAVQGQGPHPVLSFEPTTFNFAGLVQTY